LRPRPPAAAWNPAVPSMPLSGPVVKQFAERRCPVLWCRHLRRRPRRAFTTRPRPGRTGGAHAPARRGIAVRS